MKNEQTKTVNYEIVTNTVAPLIAAILGDQMPTTVDRRWLFVEVFMISCGNIEKSSESLAAVKHGSFTHILTMVFVWSVERVFFVSSQQNSPIHHRN